MNCYNYIQTAAIFNNRGLLISIDFCKQLGTGKIFLKSLLDKFFINSLNIVINLLKYKFIWAYNEIKKYNIYINIKPNNFIKSGASINLAIFIGLISLLYNFSISKNLLVLGHLNIHGKILNIDCIHTKLNILNKNIKYVILPKFNFINFYKLFNKNFDNLCIIKVANIFEILNLLGV